MAYILVVAPFTGAWIEIPRVANSCKKVDTSHPSRVRGLKWKFDVADGDVRQDIAPFTGAWIEDKVKYISQI